MIARNSSFTYKGKAVDVRQVARELGVRYVLEGSVRKAGNQVRITGQLIDAATGAHLWADRFDGSLDDIFEWQRRGKLILRPAGIDALFEVDRAEARRIIGRIAGGDAAHADPGIAVAIGAGFAVRAFRPAPQRLAVEHPEHAWIGSIVILHRAGLAAHEIVTRTPFRRRQIGGVRRRHDRQEQEPAGHTRARTDKITRP